LNFYPLYNESIEAFEFDHLAGRQAKARDKAGVLPGLAQ
jgi:hypothetical protein